MHDEGGPAHQPGSAGEVLGLLRHGRVRTRTELAELTKQSRTTISQRLAVLVGAGLVREADRAASTGGRPSAAFAFDGAAHHVLAVDLGARHATYAVADLDGTVLATTTDPVRVADGPQVVIELVGRRLEELRAGLGLSGRAPRALGIGLPGPVDHTSGRPTSPPIMPGWDGCDVRRVLGERFGCPVFADNDANLLALGERALAYPDVDDLVYVKVATGIGAGIISGGRLLHGAAGAAGDLGHVHSPAAGDRMCRCGNRGCLEALAGGQAVAAALTAQGVPARSSADLTRLVQEGSLPTIQALRAAGRALGDVLSTCIALLNPRVLVLGGEMVAIGEPLLAGVRESVFSRALPLAGRDLRVAVARSGALGGVRGAAHLAIEGALAPAALAALEIPAGDEGRAAG
ncbi:sugar kinase [Cellulomonas hominis]|uniref:Sugar kinase n=1 Tax=Cellulomonas hominis TaxID=156981 RepID=A0A511FAX6_9CELL|nr:ROK family transcriptional regulator [Cellulomonas hominis]MBB5473135.1 putative NBD/HSP70 family sugar kinase [Cellulomonas hominis]GEL45437.1 sugar kinase [Cellulomonas hominis]